jgi:4'-phosphopantetheinyl transferase
MLFVAYRTIDSVLPLFVDAEAHVWYAELAALPGGGFEVLDEEERARASRFRSLELRNWFVAAHCFLRQVLSQYLDTRPAEIRFRHLPRGKPELAESRHIRFNLSHTRDIAVVAVARDREVDVEDVRDTPDILDLARRYFSSVEAQWVESAPPEVRAEAFFTCWTGKEAYVKGRGDGLSFPLDGFQVLPRAGSDLLELQVYGDPRESCRWRIERLPVPPGYLAALAMEGASGRARVLRWL